MFTLKNHLVPLVFCFCWKGRPLSNEQRANGWKPCAMTETWRPILQQLITELERQSVRMRELEAQRLVDLSVSWRLFLWDVICFWSWNSMKYVTYYIHMNFMWICIILIKRDGVLDIFQQKSKTSMVSCGVWSEEENSRPKREGDSQIFIFPFG